MVMRHNAGIFCVMEREGSVMHCNVLSYIADCRYVSTGYVRGVSGNESSESSVFIVNTHLV